MEIEAEQKINKLINAIDSKIKTLSEIMGEVKGNKNLDKFLQTNFNDFMYIKEYLEELTQS